MYPRVSHRAAGVSEEIQQADIRPRPDSPALPLGFVPWDFSQAGLHGDTEWVKRPKRVERPPFSPPEVQSSAE